MSDLLTGAGGKRHVADWLDGVDEDWWRQHVGPEYEWWVESKLRFDPQGLFCSLLPPDGRGVALGPPGYTGQEAMREMTVYGVSFDMVGRQPIVLLKTADGSQFLPIWIGHAEAAAILMKLQGSTPVRPLTHDLMSSILGQLEAEVVRITVTELRDSTFYASITLRQDGQELEIDSRPSDAIALAVRVEAKIFATDEVIEESAIEFEGDDEENERRIARVSGLADLDPEEFRRFLDSVTAEDFAQAEGEDEPEARD